MIDGTVLPNKGIYATENVALRGVVERLVDGLNPVQVWLFGSRARGDHQPDSDFDLLVVTRPEDGENGRDFGCVRRPLLGSGVGCDVVPVRLDDFTAEMDSPVSMIAEIMGEAVRVYDERGGYCWGEIGDRPKTR